MCGTVTEPARIRDGIIVPIIRIEQWEDEDDSLTTGEQIVLYIVASFFIVPAVVCAVKLLMAVVFRGSLSVCISQLELVVASIGE